MQRLSLKRNVSWTFAGNVLYAGGQMLLLVLLAKQLDAERVGMYALGLAITTPIVIFANLALRQVLATDARASVPFSHYLTLRLLMTGAALVVIGGVILFGGYRGETAAVIGAIGLTKAVESISDVFYGLFQQHERLDRMARSMIWRSATMVPALAIGVVLSHTAAWGVLAIVLAWLAVLLLHDVPQGRRFLRAGAELDTSENGNASLELPGFIDFNRASLWRLARLALPLAFATMLTSLQTQVPRYLIERYLGVALLGIYAGMAYPMIALRTLVTALGQSAAPRLATLYAQGRGAEFRRLLLKLMGIGALGGVLLVLVVAFAGKLIILLLYKPEFATHLDAFTWIAVAGAVTFVVSFTGYGMTALRIFKIQPVLTGVAVAITAGLCFWLVPAYGLTGAAWATLAVASLQLIVNAVIVWSGSHRPLREAADG